MGIFGSLLGGGLGFLFGGPLGAVLGGLAGHHFGEQAQRNGLGGDFPQSGGGRVSGGGAAQQASAAEMQRVFAVALTSLAAKVAKADGKVTADEIRTFDRFLKEGLRLDEDERRLASRVFNAARDNRQPAAAFANQIRMLFRAQPERLADIVVMLLAIAHADGHLHPREDAMIEDIARRFGLDARGYASCKAQFEATHGQGSGVDPYEVLGVARTATDAELKSAHRKLVREYHPDTLQSKGLPAEFMEFATEKMVAVNAAWAEVKAERGL